MDVQQRQLLNVSLEALGPATLADSAARRGLGVYAAVASSDYGALVKAHMPQAGAYHATANALSVVAGRLSFSFGLQGKLVFA